MKKHVDKHSNIFFEIGKQNQYRILEYKMEDVLDVSIKNMIHCIEQENLILLFNLAISKICYLCSV